jgi:hypothetical protein
VNLFGRTLRERAEFLIGVAHPDVRGELRRAFAETRHVVLDPGHLLRVAKIRRSTRRFEAELRYLSGRGKSRRQREIPHVAAPARAVHGQNLRVRAIPAVACVVRSISHGLPSFRAVPC